MYERSSWKVLLATFLAFGLLVAACGNDDGGGGAESEPMTMPGEGVSVSMARANWSTGYMQAAIYRTLLQELGYEVSNPAEAELAPATFYPALGEGDYDFWVNGWFPIHTTLIQDAGVEDIVQPIGNEIVSGGLQGFVVDKTTAEAHGITMLDDIGDDPEIAALFDVDGNGKADLMGCNDGWGCQVVINDTIARNGWEDTIEQVSAEHAALFADSVGRFNRGESILQYIWTPGAFTTELVPGTDVIWLSLENPLPDQVGAAALPEEQCPGQPCEMGFVAADIRVVATNQFLSDNPAAARLFELVTIPVIDVALQNLSYGGGANTEADVQAAADQWIADNRVTVDEWLSAARAAA
ncbi:glycine betaine/L-proline ABC transporter substrate-binding protein ProX [Candidatus Poriferisocius sp.]|uniref:glycine betaine/L-proline ABC transporter substrate-binding protein ProX n=1 Tax=Candidatus Poriferisocius sp. TaxID=3101276 RepID=UPI003B018060